MGSATSRRAAGCRFRCRLAGSGPRLSKGHMMNASARDQLEPVASSNRQRFSPSIDRFGADTLMDLFDSLIYLKMSLFFKINCLLRILGNFRKKHLRLLRFLTSQTPNLARNRTTSLYFPCRSGISTQRLVRSGLHHPPNPSSGRRLTSFGDERGGFRIERSGWQRWE